MLSRSKNAAACGSGPISGSVRTSAARVPGSGVSSESPVGLGQRRADGLGGLVDGAVARHLHPTHPNSYALRCRAARRATGHRSEAGRTRCPCDRLDPWSPPSPRTRRILVRTEPTRVPPGSRTVSNLSLLAAVQAERRPDRLALVEPGVRAVTWAELNRRIDGVAGGLVDTGLLAGQRIGLDGGNSIAWVVAYLAALRAGLVVVPTDPDESTDERDSLLAGLRSASGADHPRWRRRRTDPVARAERGGSGRAGLDRDRGGHTAGRRVARGHRHHARHQRRPEDRDAQPPCAAGPPRAGQRVRHRRRRQRRPRGAALLPRVRTQRRARQLPGRRRPAGAARSGDLGSAHGDRGGAGRQPPDHPGAAVPPGARGRRRRPPEGSADGHGRWRTAALATRPAVHRADRSAGGARLRADRGVAGGDDHGRWRDPRSLPRGSSAARGRRPGGGRAGPERAGGDRRPRREPVQRLLARRDRRAGRGRVVRDRGHRLPDRR